MKLATLQLLNLYYITTNNYRLIVLNIKDELKIKIREDAKITPTVGV